MTIDQFNFLARKINENGKESDNNLFCISKTYENMTYTVQDGGYIQSILIKDDALYEKNWYNEIFKYPMCRI